MLNKMRKLETLLSSRRFLKNLLEHRVAVGVEHLKVLSSMGRMDVVIDIGANKGQFALAARYQYPGAKIHSFEPLADAALLFRRVFAKDAAVFLYQCAIGPEVGHVPIHVSGRADSSSLLPISAAQNATFPGTAEVSQQVIPVKPLSACISTADLTGSALLKLDVQGFELQALMGCESYLSYFSFVYVECSFVELYVGQALAHEVIEWLHQRGFRLAGVFNMFNNSDGTPVQADFVFGRALD